VKADVIGRLMQQALNEALESEHLAAIGTPDVATEQAEPGAPLRFTASFEIYPQIQVRAYDELKLQRVITPVTDGDVDRYLEELRESMAQLRPIEGRATVEHGDVALIDYEGRLEDRVVARGENRPCQVGGGRYPAGFEARLLGAAVGETLEFPVTYPTEDAPPELAGQTVQFRVVLRGLAAKEVPVLDDEFAKDHGECDTLGELRERVRRNLEVRGAQQAEASVRAQAVSQLVAANEFDLPETLIARQTEEMMVDVAEGWRARRIWPKDEAQAFTALREQLAPRARERVKAALVLDAIAREERIDVTDADVDAEIGRSAAAAGEAAERVRALASQPAARHGLRERLRRDRALEWVLARANVITIEPPPHVAGAEESR
jgi:trigger factor